MREVIFEHLEKFEDELNELSAAELTPEHVAKVTKTALVRMLDPKIRSTHKSKVVKALGAVEFDEHGSIEKLSKTYVKINGLLGRMRPETREALNNTMHSQGSFARHPALSIVAKKILATKLKDAQQVETLCSVVRQTSSVFRDAHKEKLVKIV